MGFINYQPSTAKYQMPITRRILLFALLAIAFLAGCNTSKPLSPADARNRIVDAWSQPMHGIWELTWTAMPIEGAFVFEAWTTQNADRQRFEVLEASSPALVGMAYVNDGERARVFNRLEADEPPFDGSVDTPFSPVTDARAFIGWILAQTPQSAEATSDGSYILRYPDEQILRVSFNSQTGFIDKIALESPTDELTLNARTVETLTSPPATLFIAPKN